MRKWLLIFAAVVVCALAASCGGGGGDGGSDNQIDPNTSMIGIWQPISATRDGSPTRVDDVMPDTNQQATRWEMEYRQDATCTFRAFDQNNTLLETFNGTWNSDNQVAPVHIAGTTLDVHWSDFGNVMTAEYTLDGHPVVAMWVRTTPAPSEHEAGWVHTWQAQSVEINGEPSSAAAWFKWANGSTAETMEMQANGTAIFREKAGDSVVKTLNETWATGANVFTLTYGGRTYWGYWQGQFLVLVFLDPATGDTVKITWQQVGP